MRIFKSILFVLLLGFQGCSSLIVATDLNGQRLSAEGTTVAHINGSCWGFYLLYYIPIASGSLEKPGSFSLFRHNIPVDKVVGMVTKKSQELGATRIQDLQSFTDSWWQSWSLFFWVRASYVSGNACR